MYVCTRNSYITLINLLVYLLEMCVYEFISSIGEDCKHTYMRVYNTLNRHTYQWEVHIKCYMKQAFSHWWDILSSKLYIFIFCCCCCWCCYFILFCCTLLFFSSALTQCKRIYYYYYVMLNNFIPWNKLQVYLHILLVLTAVCVCMYV